MEGLEDKVAQMSLVQEDEKKANGDEAPAEDGGSSSNLEELVLEAACGVFREGLIQAALRRRQPASTTLLEDEEGLEYEYAPTHPAAAADADATGPRLEAEQLREIDERAATMLAHGRAQKPKVVRQFLKDQLTSLKFDLPDQLNRKIEAILEAERQNVREVALDDVPRLHEGAQVAVWRGDITTLRVDGIVNAANEYMLGCFTPNHPCIDNAIHCKAGPRLREACRTLMREQGHLEKTGTAKITEGYCLPSRFVLHTVGPICRIKGVVKPGQEAQLRSCYWECLELAKKHGLRSVAFCCISTGVFGYPQDEAAHVALKTVREWLETDDNKQRMDLVIFNVFTPRDLHIYHELAPQYFGPAEEAAPVAGADEATAPSTEPATPASAEEETTQSA